MSSKARSAGGARPRPSAHSPKHCLPACALLAAALLSACAAGPGAGPSPTPPQLFINDHGLKQWDHPEAFGPVPANMLATGREYCATLNTRGKHFEPTGYHAHALSVEGFPFEDGGFYCTQN